MAEKMLKDSHHSLYSCYVFLYNCYVFVRPALICPIANSRIKSIESVAELIFYGIYCDSVRYDILCYIVSMLCMLSSYYYHCDDFCGNVVCVYQCRAERKLITLLLA